MSDQNTNDDALSLTENGGTRAEISTGNAANAALQNVNTPDDGVTSAHVALESPHAANRRDSTLFACRSASPTDDSQTAGAAVSEAAAHLRDSTLFARRNASPTDADKTAGAVDSDAAYILYSRTRAKNWRPDSLEFSSPLNGLTCSKCLTFFEISRHLSDVRRLLPIAFVKVGICHGVPYLFHGLVVGL